MKEFLKKKKKFIIIALLVVLFTVGPFGGIHVAQAQSSGICSFYIIGGLCGFVIDILFIPFIVTAWILGIAGLVLNFVMDYTVTNMQGNIAGITGIDIAWGTIRDVMNLTFIFVLLYTAIGTILDVNGVNWKKSITSIIIAAVLINFSLFFTKVIIDASNIATLTFYRQIVPTNSPVGVGLSNSFMQPLGLTSLWNPTQGANLLQGLASNFTAAAEIAIGGSVFLLITALVFFAVSIMFLIRYITFIFLLILSPVAFMGSIVPKLSSWVNKWWGTLWNQVIFAPVFMVMVWVVVVIINNSQFICANGAPQGNFADLFLGTQLNPTAGTTACLTGSAIGLVINFVIIVAFIIGALVTAKELASQGGSVGQKLVTGALGFGAAAGGWAGRNTIGRGADALANSKDLKAWASKSRVGGLALSAASKTATSSFDARAGAKWAGDKTGVDIGLGGKSGGRGGYQQLLKNQVKKREDREEQLRKVSESEVLSRVKPNVAAAQRKADWEMPAIENARKAELKRAVDLRRTDPTSKTIDAEAKAIEDAANKKYEESKKKVEETRRAEVEKAYVGAKEDAGKDAKTRAENYVAKLEKGIWVARKDKEAAQKIRAKKKQKSPGQMIEESIAAEVKKRIEAAAPSEPPTTPEPTK